MVEEEEKYKVRRWASTKCGERIDVMRVNSNNPRDIAHHWAEHCIFMYPLKEYTIDGVPIVDYIKRDTLLKNITSVGV